MNDETLLNLPVEYSEAHDCLKTGDYFALESHPVRAQLDKNRSHVRLGCIIRNTPKKISHIIVDVRRAA